MVNPMLIFKLATYLSKAYKKGDKEDNLNKEVV